MYALIGTSVTMLGAFVISRREFPMRKFLTALFLMTMFFSGGLLPTYLLIKSLGMYNTLWALVLPLSFNAYLTIIARTYIKSSIPEELFEAVSLDGGSYYQFFMKMLLPLSKPILAVIALNFTIWQWNSYFPAMIYLKDADKFPLQIILRNILVSNIFDIKALNSVDVKSVMEKQYLAELLKYSLIVVGSVPMLVIYPFIQKYFLKGVMIGSLKG
jgi:multiple sugar transport system permease protein/putative aldouronate transport system permease protein